MAVPEPHPTPVAEQPLIPSASEEPRLLFASTRQAEPRQRSGLGVWVAAAASLVIGILIGFYSGYQAGQGNTLALFPSPAAAPQERQSSEPKPTTGFSESTIPDPSRIDPEPIVPTPAAPTPSVPAARQGEPSTPRSTATPPATAAPAATPPVGAATRDTAPAPEKAPRARTTPRATAPVPAIPTGPGTVRVLSRPPGAQVFLDGRVIGKTPLEIGALAPGAHNIRLELPGFNQWETTVDLKPGDELRVAGTLEQQ